MFGLCFDCLLNWLNNWSQTVAGLGSLVFSALLVILYYKQHQQLSMEHRGILEVTDAEWENDEADLQISNYGNGVVNNLELVTFVYTPSGEHRDYSWMRNRLTRKDKQGGLANTIQPQEEDIPFEGKSRVGLPMPSKYPDHWRGIDFSLFIRQMKSKDVEEVKFLHFVLGTDLSANRCLAVVGPTARSIDPQEFEMEHSLENLPGVWFHSRDDTFQRYFERPLRDKIKRQLYRRGIQVINLIPYLEVSGRPPDTSGYRLVKHVIIRRNVVNRLRNPRETAHWLKEKIPLIERLPSIGQ